jgi:hypothetical protein
MAPNAIKTDGTESFFIINNDKNYAILSTILYIYFSAPLSIILGSSWLPYSSFHYGLSFFVVVNNYLLYFLKWLSEIFQDLTGNVKNL